MKSAELQKKIGHLFVVGFEGKSVPDYIRKMIHDDHIGGIILFSRNIGTPSEVLELTTELQLEAKRAGYEQPLLICLDQENGIVRRLGEGTTLFPGSMALGATHNADNAYQVGLATGKELKALGINWNLAPDADVNNNPRNPVIGVRSFGESAGKVAEFAQAAMKGMQDAGIITTLKHFPGIGDMDIDPHLDLPVISHDRERLDSVELHPFKTCIDSGADTVMTAHIYFPAIDDETGLPATLSRKVITGLLREEIGFTGVVTTDCLEMKAIADGVGTEQGTVHAIQAGVDLAMISHTEQTQKAALQAVYDAAVNDEAFMNVIDAADQRIYDLKAKYLRWEDLQLEKSTAQIDVAQHCDLAERIYRDSVTIAKNDGILPLKLNKESTVLVVDSDEASFSLAEDQSNTDFSFGQYVQTHHPNTTVVQLNAMTEEADMSQYECVVLCTRSLNPSEKVLTLANDLYETGVPFVVAALKSPYELSRFPKASAHICTYESTTTAIEIAVAAMFGEVSVQGRLPVNLPDV
ncbi:Beta-N-acetylhexosaminidase [Lentibacillus sp. JNUCC-1]|uniref:glycoside hydrolase family 3 protein n=1 Tax=Lentibacillus sp. JNUCC-1 TaxID=2654513 RepID=UPI0012E81AAE|nr:glycoside hydrolase family 3 protein [Lentibacillus sp. JNUCC-1]MUV39017.1 Beta-N-acetylhexosaminidase [Lentibacillus sp. JNUCC-1]